MKITFSLLILTLLALSALANSQRGLQEQPLHKPERHLPPRMDPNNPQFNIDDPFLKRTSPQTAKKNYPKQAHKTQFPNEQESQKVWQTYKPFDYDEKKKARGQDEDYYEEFNQLLKWGMLAGSVFLVVVLVKTCTKKHGLRERRRLREQGMVRGRMNQAVQQMGVYYQQAPVQSPAIININPQPQQETLQQKINNAERQLNKLKALKQEAMKQQFNRKKMEQEQQKRVEMFNAQRKQQFQQARRNQNWSVGYGPVFYGQNTPVYAHQVYQPQVQQPFQVKGIEPIRKRSNSFKTQVSQQPILNNDIKYRNGIPIGKPVRQHDNDSSFASQYPQV